MSTAQQANLFRPDEQVGPEEATVDVERDAALSRSNLYRFLAAVYLDPPTEQLLERLTCETTLEALTRVFGHAPVSGVRGWCAGARLPESLSALQQEYMDLFAVPGARYVTPFEDVYAGADGDGPRGPLLGPRAVEILRMYRACGMEVDRSCRELPTHIGVELSFMALLCLREATASADSQESEETGQAPPCRAFYRTLQRQFVEDHLEVWFPLLQRQIEARASSGFYPALTELTAAFLKQDLAHLEGEIH